MSATNKADWKLLDHAPPDPLLRQAWIDGLMWAIGITEIMNRFTEETGFKYIPPRNPIERMIDESTGHQAAFVQKFTEWYNENIWGGTEECEP